MNQTAAVNWYERVPKVELHLHLEGAIPLTALWELVKKYGGDSTVPDQAALQQRFKFRDFPDFIETWVWKNQFLREYEDFSFIAEAVAADLTSQNIRYAEIFYSPPDFARHGLRTRGLTQAIRAGLNRVAGIKVRLVADLVRDFGPGKAAITLAEVAEVKDSGVIGVGIGGSEHDFPPEPFQLIYEQARKQGFHTSAHAGEAAGPESVWGAIRALQVDRIGHGTRAGEDQALLDFLVEKQIPIEMCPISNLRTGVIASIAQHPIREYFERGLLVTVNTDDPKMFGNSLAVEYQVLVDRLDFSKDQVRRLILNAIQASWLPAVQKADLARSFALDPGWL
jgi:adenosine deaminase